MKSTRKIISVLLAVVMVIATLPIIALDSAAYSSYTMHTSEDGLWQYQILTDGTVSLWKYLGTDGNIVIPAQLDGHTVPGGTWHGLFDGLDGEGVFVPVSVTFSEGLTCVGEGTFEYCGNLTEVVLPDTITKIGEDAFVGTPLYNDENNWEDGILYIGNCLIKADSSVSGDIKIKDGTRLIASNAFFGCNEITSISFPDSLQIIGSYSFFGCDKLTDITLPDALRSIGDEAFDSCTMLETVSLPEGMEYIGDSSFYNTSFYNNEDNWENGILYAGSYLLKANSQAGSIAEVKDGTSLIAARAFSNVDGIERVILPQTVKIINDAAFNDCPSLKYVRIPASVEEIGSGVFAYNASLKSVVVDATLTKFGWRVFTECPALETVVLGNGITYLSDDEFYNCKALKSVKLPDTLEIIGDKAFCECPNLTSITLPDSLKSIGESVFFAHVDWHEETYNGQVVIANVWKFCLETIYGHTGTFAQSYASYNNIRFIELGTFPDVPKTAWYYDAAMYNSDRGFITGYKNGTFGGGDMLQRQDFIIILARIAEAGLDSYNECALGDVDMSAYYGKSVAWAVANDIIKGYENGKFGVGDPITREQVAVILYSFTGKPDKGSESAIAGFADKDRISSFAKDAMIWAVNNGVITGRNSTTLAPTDTASRAEIATMIARMDQKGMFD